MVRALSTPRQAVVPGRATLPFSGMTLDSRGQQHGCDIDASSFVLAAATLELEAQKRGHVIVALYSFPSIHERAEFKASLTDG